MNVPNLASSSSPVFIHSQYGEIDFMYSKDQKGKRITIEALSGPIDQSSTIFLEIGIELHRFITEGYVFDCTNMSGSNVSKFISRFSGILRAYKTVNDVNQRILAPNGILKQ